MRVDFRKQMPFVFLVAIAGCCTSATSTILLRDQNDRMVGNSNGKNCLHDQATPFKGIPITVTVPTHLDVKIHEDILFEKGTLQRVTNSTRNLRVETEAVYTSKLFSVDPNKVIEGETKYTMGFENNVNPQYPSSITYNTDDKTISQIAKSIDKLAPAIKALGAASPAGEKTTSIFDRRERMVAWKRFDINDPAFEQNVKEFVDHHVNNCSSCCENSAFITNLGQ